MWNGRGARLEEKKAALTYAASLCGDPDSVIVLNEGEDDDDEMFWAVLSDGGREYAKAFHWAWRACMSTNDPQLWRISASPGRQVCVTHLATETRLMHPSLHTSPPAPTHHLGTASLFWTCLGRYLCSLVLKPGASARISD